MRRHVEVPDAFSAVGVHSFNQLSLKLVGLVAQKSGATVIGSAAGNSTWPIERAYMELLERMATQSFMEGSNQVSVGEPGSWVSSKSNGVAVGRSEKEARTRAALEIIERDTVLRSWYLTEPWSEFSVPSYYADVFKGHYRVVSAFSVSRARLPSLSRDSNVYTFAVFAFPLLDKYPLSYGFAARTDISRAQDAALGECLQRIGFLWNEKAPQSPPPVSLTPMYHQDYFLYPRNQKKLLLWLDRCFSAKASTLRRFGGWSYLDLTPMSWKGKLSVMKATHRNAIPLTFGKAHPYFPDAPRSLAVHPIS